MLLLWHANIRHHHLSCMNTALAKARFDMVKIIESIAKELLSNMEKIGSKTIVENFQKDLNILVNELEDKCTGCPTNARIAAISSRWKGERACNNVSSPFLTWHNNTYNAVPICCEWGIVSFNPQEATTNLVPEGTIDLIHIGIFTKNITNLANEAFDAVKESMSNKRLNKDEVK